MLKIAIIAVGKLKESGFFSLSAEYEKRLAPHAKLSTIEVTSEPTSATTTPAQAMRTEGERLLARIPEDAYVIALDRTGKDMGSVEFAQLLRAEGEGGRLLAFVIGGAEGLDASVLARAQRKLSLSKMTLVHEMARVFLLEQIYRACTILAGKTYHR